VRSPFHKTVGRPVGWARGRRSAAALPDETGGRARVNTEAPPVSVRGWDSGPAHPSTATAQSPIVALRRAGAAVEHGRVRTSQQDSLVSPAQQPPLCRGEETRSSDRTPATGTLGTGRRGGFPSPCSSSFVAYHAPLLTLTYQA
jgi:hypothetical protein